MCVKGLRREGVREGGSEGGREDGRGGMIFPVGPEYKATSCPTYMPVYRHYSKRTVQFLQFLVIQLCRR